MKPTNTLLQLSSLKPRHESVPILGPLVNEVIVLTTRIQKLLSRGTSDAALHGLRKRIEALLLTIICEVAIHW